MIGIDSVQISTRMIFPVQTNLIALDSNHRENSGEALVSH